MAAGSRTDTRDVWKYSQDVFGGSQVIKHYPNAYKLISWILKKEGCKGAMPFGKEMAVYMESINDAIHKGTDKKHIVDFAIGIRNKNGSGKSKKIRLIEAKLNSKDTENIETNELRIKINDTMSILREEGITIESGAVILISDGSKAEQNRSKLSRRLANSFDVFTISRFYSEFFKK